MSDSTEISKVPLMLVLAQVAYTPSPEVLSEITTVKTALGKQGFPVADVKQQSSFSIGPQNPVPHVNQNSYWTFTTMDARRSVVVAQNSVVIYDTNYGRFDQFRARLHDVLSTIADVTGEGCFTRSVALRYVSGYQETSDTSNFLHQGVRGVDMEKLPNDHFHHSYNFWCNTNDGGRLVVGVKTVHGNQLAPGDFNSVGLKIDPKFNLSRTDIAVQIDIHETIQEKQMLVFEAHLVEEKVAKMRANIKSGFFACTTEEARKQWGIQE